MHEERPIVRLTGMLVIDGRLLVVEEHIDADTRWSLPGGALERGETCEEALVREMREETGLDVAPVELLYVTDRFRHGGRQVVDLCFLLRLVGGDPERCEPLDTDEIGRVELVAIDDLTARGFSPKLAALVREGFPNRGTYQGEFHELYG